MKAVYCKEAEGNVQCKDVAEQALARALAMSVDKHVRTIAESDERGKGPNWCRAIAGMSFACTSGAGTNSASVCRLERYGQRLGVSRVLYRADGYGAVLYEFHDGEWVNELAGLAQQCEDQGFAREQDRHEQARHKYMQRYLPVAGFIDEPVHCEKCGDELLPNPSDEDAPEPPEDSNLKGETNETVHPEAAGDQEGGCEPVL